MRRAAAPLSTRPPVDVPGEPSSIACLRASDFAFAAGFSLFRGAAAVGAVRAVEGEGRSAAVLDDWLEEPLPQPATSRATASMAVPIPMREIELN
jgi:hypothetical protein